MGDVYIALSTKTSQHLHIVHGFEMETARRHYSLCHVFSGKGNGVLCHGRFSRRRMSSDKHAIAHL